MTESTKTILVLGGTGKTGRRVAARLTARGLPVRVGSRAAATPFDWTDQDTWAPVLRDIDSVYLVFYPDLAFPGAADAIRAFTRLAVDGGTRRLVLLSGRGEEEAIPSEQAVRDSGADWTILRASWFFQNFSEHFLLGPVLDGQIALPAGSVAEPFIDADDIADVAVAALTGDGHTGRLYDLTGPRLLTFAEAAAEISRAVGREVGYVPVSPDRYAAAATAHGVPVEQVTALTDLFTRVLDGRNAHLTDGVRQALGRAPRDFTDYVRDAAASGVWNR
ncbi:NAD(P)H-binding protein [Micromonospora sonneratiae]|uniref:NAD(P)H-binding protein n=1 Tax=Micromonospora sonneratiae TaxID=1184706 RepID=A0ABW3YKW3_9ACTN